MGRFFSHWRITLYIPRGTFQTITGSVQARPKIYPYIFKNMAALPNSVGPEGQDHLERSHSNRRVNPIEIRHAGIYLYRTAA